jgi:hypothetical protein
MTDVWLTLREAADRLGVSYEWLRLQALTHKVPHRRIARQYRFTDDDIAAIKAMHFVEASEPPPEPIKPKRKTSRVYPKVSNDR